MTMKRRSDGKRKMLKRAVIGGLCISLGNGVEGAENGFLRRSRIEEPREPIGGTESTDRNVPTIDAMTKMEDLWSQAAAAAQVELDTERMLWRKTTRSSQDFSMSMPSRPTTAPRPTPPTAPNPTPRPPTGDCLQGRTREEYVYDLLVEITPADILNDPSTPQGMAFDFLANDDPYLVDPCVSNTIEQRYGLTTLYYSLAGQDWSDSEGWLGEDQECLWFGVDCLGDDPNVVTRVTLSNNSLVGSLPNEIAAIAMLERIDLFSNAVTGSLPTTISGLSSLILLDVEQNLLSGQAFPPELFELSSLLAYRASNNFLSGSISTDIVRLNKLQQVWLATNQIDGSIPSELGACSDLESVFLYENAITGTLPTELGSLAKLEDLRLYQNSVTNKIPSELFGATSLESLRLELNLLSGSIPTEIGALTLLTDLQLDTNALSGPLPSEIGGLVLLENLIINNNFLTEQIPDVFQNLKSLDFLDAANNLFFGTIPETIFDVTSLQFLYLSNNTLSGSIPTAFSRPSLLRDLYLDGNGLVGTVPEISSGELQQLNEFLVHFNFLSGSMPASLCSLRSSGDLEDLFADCGGQAPEIECDFPACCNRCFEGGDLARRRQTQENKGRKLKFV